jgi:hypothetical protein
MRLPRLFAIALLLGAACSGAPTAARGEFRIATFSAVIAPPVGHALCGSMVKPSARVGDPLYARGLVLWGGDAPPVVFAALDWTEVRNEAYERWRSQLARAADTSPQAC